MSAAVITHGSADDEHLVNAVKAMREALQVEMGNGPSWLSDETLKLLLDAMLALKKEVGHS